MDEQDVLRHLLEVESNAASLVNDAQAEADKRVAENEKQNRSRFDDQYNKEAARLEKNYQDSMVSIKAGYGQELKTYQESFTSEKVDTAAFTRIAESFFFKGE